MVKTAVISECGRYRYRLTRTWDDEVSPLVFVMLNPSTANADMDDPTIRKCVGFAQHNGFGGIEVYNLFAWRATNPKELVGLENELRVGPENNKYLSEIDPFFVVVAAWGMNPYKHGMETQVEKVLRMLGSDVHCVKKSNDRPWHPLYVPYGELLRLNS